jgi:hypothetical protein
MVEGRLLLDFLAHKVSSHDTANSTYTVDIAGQDRTAAMYTNASMSLILDSTSLRDWLFI